MQTKIAKPTTRQMTEAISKLVELENSMDQCFSDAITVAYDVDDYSLVDELQKHLFKVLKDIQDSQEWLADKIEEIEHHPDCKNWCCK